MKKLLYLIILIIGTSSCLTVNRIQRNCDKFAAICVTETETVVEYKDTTIFEIDTFWLDWIGEVPLPKDSVRIRDSVNVVTVYNEVTGKYKNVATMDSVYREQGIIGVWAWVNNSKLGVDAFLKDSSFLFEQNLMLTQKDSITIYNAIKRTVTDNTVVLPPERYVPKIYKIALWIVIILIVYLGLWLYFKGKIGIALDKIKQVINKNK